MGSIRNLVECQEKMELSLFPKAPLRKRERDFPSSPEKFTREDYKDLVDALNWHSYLYYTLDSPEISDREYDRMYHLLEEVEKLNPDWILPFSPTQKIGGEIREEFPTVVHDPPMMSLANANSWEEVVEFDKRIKRLLGLPPEEKILYHMEPKLDGLAVELLYEDGVFIQGSTRGNGYEGEDITHNLKTIRNLPLKLFSHKGKPIPKKLYLRGECILPWKEFESLNEELQKEGKKPFANPRNAAAGSLRQQDSSIARKRPIYCYIYGFGKYEGIENFPSTQKEFLEWIKDFSLPVVFPTRRGTLEEIPKFYEELLVNRHSFPFDMDGIVIKVDRISYWELLGHTTKAPRWAIAYKFPGHTGISRLEKVEFQVGRTGLITPVGKFTPVNIGGVVVKRATLHNKEEIKRLDIKVGDLCEIKRAGEVIPKVIRVLKEKRKGEEKEILFPKECPICKKPLQEEEIYVRCINPNCPGRRLSQLKFFVSKAGLDIEGIGEEWVEKFFQLGLVKDIADFFYLKEEDLSPLEGMGEILPKKMIQSIQKRKKVPFATFLKALGIPNVGEHIAEVLAENFSSLEELINASKERLLDIEEIGPIIADSILQFFQEEENQKVLKKLFSAGVEILYPKKERISSPLSGKRIVFTGTLKNFTREEAQRVAKKLGAKVSNSVSKKTDYVVVGESPGSKYEKAKKLGVPILNEEDFLKLIQDASS